MKTTVRTGWPCSPWWRPWWGKAVSLQPVMKTMVGEGCIPAARDEDHGGGRLYPCSPWWRPWWGQAVSLQPMMKTMVGAGCPCSPWWRPWWGRLSLQPVMKTMVGTGCIPAACDEDHGGGRLYPRSHGADHGDAGCPYSLWWRPWWGQAVSLQPMMKTMVGAGLPYSPWWRPWWGRLALQPMMKTTAETGCPYSHGADHGGADLHPQPMEDPTLEQGVTEGGCDPVGSPRRSRILAGAMAPWREEPTPEHVCWQNLWPYGGPMLEQFMEDCLLWKGPTLEQGKSVRSPPPEEEGVAESSCDELTAGPVPRPPALLGRTR